MVGGKSTCVLSFNQNVPAREALSFSEDGRYAICSTSDILIMEFVNKPISTVESKFVIRLFTADLTQLRFNVGITREMINTIFKRFSKGDQEVFGLDVSVRQSLWSDHQEDFLYKAAKWSPRGLSNSNRCLLGTLLSDHRVCIHREMDDPWEKWTQVVDLSVLYNEHQLKEWPELETNKITVSELQNRIHSMAAVDIDWSPLYASDDIQTPSSHSGSSQDAFCLLAVAMRSGHVTLWKVLSNVRSREDVKLVSVTKACSADLECVKWCPHSESDIGLLAIGGVDGEIVLFHIRISDDIEVVKVTTLWNDLDQLTVSCLAWNKQGSMQYLLANKEVFILGFGLEKKGGNYESVKKTHTRGKHSLQATAFISNLEGESSKILLASGDGCLQNVAINEQDGNEMEILTDAIDVGLDLRKRWKIHGLSITPNNIFALLLVSPTSKVDHKIFRERFQVYCISLIDVEKECETLLLKVLSSEGPFEAIADIMEILRQHYCEGKTFPEFFTLMMEASDKWLLLSSQQLKILRYFAMTKLSLYKTSKGNKSEKVLRSLQKDVTTLRDLILTRHACTAMKLLQGEAIPLRKTEMMCLRVLCDKVKREATETGIRSVAESIWHKFELDKSQKDSCHICGQDFELSENNTVKCPNGHHFGCCCISLLSCQTIPYRKCVVCGALALQQQQMKDFPWLCPSNLVICSLCGGNLT